MGLNPNSPLGRKIAAMADAQAAPPTMTCAQCGSPFVRRSFTHIYCEACSEARDLERKRVWAAGHPLPPEVSRERESRRRDGSKERGTERSRAAARGVMWFADELPSLVWMVRFFVPFSYAASKNHIYTKRAAGHVALRRDSQQLRDLIERRTRETVARLAVVQAKVYIDLLVQKPDHRGDAINVIDLVCDGIKRGIGVDDRWFCIRRLDWQIVKQDPRLWIGIGQADRSDRKVCCMCGFVLKVTKFHKSKGAAMGVGRICKKCSRAKG